MDDGMMKFTWIVTAARNAVPVLVLLSSSSIRFRSTHSKKLWRPNAKKIKMVMEKTAVTRATKMNHTVGERRVWWFIYVLGLLFVVNTTFNCGCYLRFIMTLEKSLNIFQWVRCISMQSDPRNRLAFFLSTGILLPAQILARSADWFCYRNCLLGL